MPRKRKRVKPKKELRHVVAARVTEEEYSKLVGLLPYTARYNMSMLLRHILTGRAIRIFTRNTSMDLLVSELGIIRQQLKSTGRKVNQYTRRFTAGKNEAEWHFFAKMAFSMATSVEPDIDRLLEIAQILSKEFLHKNDKGKGLQSGTRCVPKVYMLAAELAAAAEQQQIGSGLPPCFGASQPG